MKSRLFALVLLCCCIHNSLTAQTFNFDYSERFNMFTGFGNAVSVKNGYLVVKHNADPTKWFQDVTLSTLLMVNPKMELVKKADIPIEHNRFMRISGLYKSKGTIALLYSYKLGKGDDEYHVCALKINEADLSFGKEIDLGTYSATRGNNTPACELRYSIDSSKYFLFNEAVQKKKDGKQFYFKVLNSDFSVINEKTVSLEAENRKVRIQSSELDKDGNVYVQYRIYDKEVEPEIMLDEDGKIPEYQTNIVRYSANGKSDLITPGLNEKILHTARMMSDHQGNLHIAGTYKSERKGRVQGVFFCTYNAATNQISDNKMSEVSSDVLALLDHDHLAKDNGKSAGISANFNPCRLTERPNGTFDLVLEYNKMESHNSMQGRNNTPVTEYELYSEAIVNVNIDKSGKMIYTRIPKKQYDGVYSANLSNYSFYVGNKLIFLYNDDKDNAERDIAKSPDNIGNFRNSVLMAATVDEKGNVERKIIFSHKDDRYISIVRDIVPISSNSFFIKRTKWSLFDISSNKFGIMNVE